MSCLCGIKDVMSVCRQLQSDESVARSVVDETETIRRLQSRTSLGSK